MSSKTDSIKHIYHFGSQKAQGNASMKMLLGGKGANLAEMSNLGLPVPPGFTITTEVCQWFFKNGGLWPEGLQSDLQASMKILEEQTQKTFGGDVNPLLVSVRSGAPVSMPGMMDTILNLGLNDTTVVALAAQTNNPRFAYDSYIRFIRMFGEVVLGVHYTRFNQAELKYKNQHHITELSVDDYKNLVKIYQDVVSKERLEIPQDPYLQLELAINAVFKSFNSPRAIYLRNNQGLSNDMGTAVNIQSMVFGNMGDSSATGVCFTRNPKTGAKLFFGEWLPNAQGEDVVAGTHTPLPLNSTSSDDPMAHTLEKSMPKAYQELFSLQQQLEQHYKDMQDIEFTIENGVLYILQTRNGKRSPAASIQIAVDLVNEGIISKKDAILSVDPACFELIMRPIIDPSAPKRVIARGLDASPGAACGKVVFNSEDAQEFHENGDPCILVRLETSPEDIQGMTVAEGILTSQGGQTSHAAVITRGMGKPCVVGCSEILVDYERELFYAQDAVIRKGDWITIDGTSGEIMEGQVQTLPPATESDVVQTLLEWADEFATMSVRANADNGPDATRARELGAVGIGLCRTEHMFFLPEALRAMREMLLAPGDEGRRRALQKILPLQREEFKEIFIAMNGLPVTIRLLDPPLHEFLPKRETDISDLAKELGLRESALKERLNQLHEVNPMMGLRGCRVGVTSPEIYQTQVRAIFEAACQLAKEGIVVMPEIMIPLVATAKELAVCRTYVVEVAEDVLTRFGCSIDYKVGTMIELPRAAIQAGAIAKQADFFSFGTNDLTQMTYGFSRDDMGKFLPFYLEENLLEENPLATFDIEGVGELVKMGTQRGRQASSRLKVGVCGEHGGDPTGIAFFHSIGLDYVSCSPFRVPVARVAAAHSAITQG